MNELPEITREELLQTIYDAVYHALTEFRKESMSKQVIKAIEKGTYRAITDSMQKEKVVEFKPEKRQTGIK